MLSYNKDKVLIKNTLLLTVEPLYMKIINNFIDIT